MSERYFELSFTMAEIYTLGNGLQQLPYKDAAPVITSIESQMNAVIESDVAALEVAEWHKAAALRTEFEESERVDNEDKN